MKFKQAQRLLREHGFDLKRVSGSHWIYSDGSRMFSLPRKSGEVHHRIEKQMKSMLKHNTKLINGKRVAK